MKPHPHAEFIKAWADGAKIEYRTAEPAWKPIFKGWSWDSEYVVGYRIKPEPAPDHVVYPHDVTYTGHNGYGRVVVVKDKLKLVFDGETGKLKAAEVLP